MNGAVSLPPWAARFYAKVNFNGPLPEHRPELGPCHLWTASLTRKRGGYGQFALNGRMRKAHQVALELAGISLTPGLVPDHLCRRPACVRPSHLDLVTDQVNIARGNAPSAVVARTNVCASGRHELTESNTIWRAAGRYRAKPARECRACDNERQKRNRQARRARLSVTGGAR